MVQIKTILNVLFFALATKTFGQQIFGQDSIYHHDSGEKIYHHSKVDSVAIFPGGESEMFKWIGMNIKYPEDAIDSGLEGIVFGSFVVEENGEVSDVKIIRSLGTSCDNAVLELFRQSPRWTPATKDGEPVRSQVTLPVRFTLVGKRSKKKKKEK